MQVVPVSLATDPMAQFRDLLHLLRDEMGIRGVMLLTALQVWLAQFEDADLRMRIIRTVEEERLLEG